MYTRSVVTVYKYKDVTGYNTDGKNKMLSTSLEKGSIGHFFWGIKKKSIKRRPRGFELDS